MKKFVEIASEKRAKDSMGKALFNKLGNEARAILFFDFFNNEEKNI